MYNSKEKKATATLEFKEEHGCIRIAAVERESPELVATSKRKRTEMAVTAKRGRLEIVAATERKDSVLVATAAHERHERPELVATAA
ncbi:hypothetical protein GGI24_003480, partial [Coemansia furcata]